MLSQLLWNGWIAEKQFIKIYVLKEVFTMAKKLYYIHTNGYDCLITDDGETRRIISNEYAHCPKDEEGHYINMDDFLKAVEDDSSWEIMDETVEEFLGNSEDCCGYESDMPKIIAEMDVDI